MREIADRWGILPYIEGRKNYLTPQLAAAIQDGTQRILTRSLRQPERGGLIARCDHGQYYVISITR